MLDDIMFTLFHIHYELGDPHLKNDMLVQHVKEISRNTWETFFYKSARKMPAIPVPPQVPCPISLQRVSQLQPCQQQPCRRKRRTSLQLTMPLQPSYSPRQPCPPQPSCSPEQYYPPQPSCPLELSRLRRSSCSSELTGIGIVSSTTVALFTKTNVYSTTILSTS